MQTSEGLDCIISTYFSTSSDVVGKIKQFSTFCKILFLTTLEYTFRFIDLRYSSNFMTTKSFTSSSVKIFTNLWNIKHYAYNKNKILIKLKSKK